MRQMITILFTAVLLMPITPLARAQESRPNSPCQADIERFCKDIELGQGRLARCLQEHEDQVSQPCKDSLKNYVWKVIAACQADAKRFCKDVRLGQGRKIRCLQEHEDQVSQPCRDSLKPPM